MRDEMFTTGCLYHYNFNSYRKRSKHYCSYHIRLAQTVLRPISITFCFARSHFHIVWAFRNRDWITRKWFCWKTATGELQQTVTFIPFFGMVKKFSSKTVLFVEHVHDHFYMNRPGIMIFPTRRCRLICTRQLDKLSNYGKMYLLIQIFRAVSRSAEAFLKQLPTGSRFPSFGFQNRGHGAHNNTFGLYWDTLKFCRPSPGPHDNGIKLDLDYYCLMYRVYWKTRIGLIVLRSLFTLV